MSLLTARLRTNLGGSVGCGDTLDDDKKLMLASCWWSDAFLIKQLVITEHLPSLSELEVE